MNQIAKEWQDYEVIDTGIKKIRKMESNDS